MLDRGEVFVGQFLPTVRELSDSHGVSRETVRRVLKAMEGEGLVASEPRHGYRLVRRPAENRKLLPVAFVLSGGQSRGRFTDFYRLQLRALQEAAEERGWSFLAVGSAERTPDEVRRVLESASVSGAILNNNEPQLAETVMGLGVPVVALEYWSPNTAGDRIEQDSYGGAFQAADFLASRGRRRIGWIGPVARNDQSLKRWGGASSGLRKHGLAVEESLVLDWPGCEDREAVRALLARPDRPDAVLALWRTPAVLAAAAAADLGLAPGRDLDLVGWCADEQRGEFLARLPGGAPVPTVAWSMQEMARSAIRRLSERIGGDQGQTLQAQIPTRLEVPESWPDRNSGQIGTEGLRH